MYVPICTNKVQNKFRLILVRKRIILTERPSLVGEVSANFWRVEGMSRRQRNRPLWPLISVF
jgi:hypothetical protein